MQRILLLFDIDGTLLTSNGAGVTAMKTVARRMFGPRFSLESVIFGGNIDPNIFFEGAQAFGLTDPHLHEPRFRDLYVEELAQQLHQNREFVRALPGVIETINRMRRRAGEQMDVELGLLTGNYTRAVPLKLRAIDLDPSWFTVTAFGDEGKTRPDLVPVAMRKFAHRHGHAPEPRRVLIIGDTPRDVHCAKVHGCSALAVATGSHEEKELIACGADVVVKDLSDPRPLSTLLDRLLA